ncbi:CDP-archaeol synthase [Desulfoferrobacter suflitae]|uniref:CDP-archaeol synthase n=1 Tax=Desulfoferrobacter suflitae TaxID=2865782 RepID=UPI00216471A2|nr:CDP-archaeol synthase [Desulfoferrobacter suflitae]MCK8604107.1 CDP-archaeol synthase [Desulfoferrobacter suflitae]
MLLYTKILLLLWLINFAPPLLAHLLGDKWNAPLDGGCTLRDGQFLLGPHKTRRGVLAGIAAGVVGGWALGFPLWLACLTGILSMSGDLLSSFVKRRCSFPSGSTVFGLDQVFEGLLPLAVVGPYVSLSLRDVLLLTLVFSVGAYLGSRFFKGILLQKPYEGYRRTVNSRVRLRELRACQITSHPLHHFLNFEDAIYYHLILKSFFRLLGVYERGLQNALQIRVSRLAFAFPQLPKAFDGYKILYLSDLHLDGLSGLTEKLQSLVRDLPADLCVIGGDLRMETHGPFVESMARMRRLLPEIRVKDGIIGILGNHDCMEIVEPLQEEGMTYLINDALAIERNGEKIWLIGVDDPHYYRCDDLEQAFQQVPAGDFSILLAHTNEAYRAAHKFGANFYLCGHCHAGQIQIPRIGPLFTHSRAPRRYSKGIWEYRGMTGYTSDGAGVSGVPLRFFSQGEVALITLRRGLSPPAQSDADLPG